MAVYDSLISRSNASALIPEEVNNSILSEAKAESVVLSKFRRIPVRRAEVRLPILSALSQAYFVDGDTGLKQTTEKAWTNKYLTIEEIASIVPIPEAVAYDTDVSVWEDIKPGLVSAAARLMDESAFIGTSAPSSWPDPIVTSAISAGNDVEIGTATADEGGIIGDHSAMLSALEQDGYSPTYGVAAKAFRGMARQARGTTGERLAEIAIGQSSVEIDGVNYDTNAMPGLFGTASGDPVAVAFDPSQFIVGVRQDITWKVLDQAVLQDASGNITFNLAQQDMIALRMVIRVGWQVANPINYEEETEADRYPAGVLVRA